MRWPFFFFSSRRRHTRCSRDWSSDVCSSDLVVRISPKSVRMAGEVTAIIERSIAGVPIATAASGFTGFGLTPERVVVTVRGPESRVNLLTRDSVRVVAHLVGKAGPGGYAHLTVSAPPGIVARAVPDSVSLKRKAGRG